VIVAGLLCLALLAVLTLSWVLLAAITQHLDLSDHDEPLDGEW